MPDCTTATVVGLSLGQFTMHLYMNPTKSPERSDGGHNHHKFQKKPNGDRITPLDEQNDSSGGTPTGAPPLVLPDVSVGSILYT